MQHVPGNRSVTDHVGPASPEAPPHARGLLQVRVVAYAAAANAHIYRPIMRLLYENRQQYGQHLPPARVAEQLKRRHGLEREVDEVASDLDQLMRWGAVEAQHDATRARRASELVRRQFVYDITPAGELTERFLEALDGLVEQAGSLQGTRLPAILSELSRLADELEGPEPDAAVLQRTLTNLVAALEELRAGSADFMRELAKVMHSTEALDEDAFHAYKGRVLEYLEGFRLDLERFAGPIARAIATVEERGVERMVDAIAAIEEAPAYDVSPDETRRRAAAQRRNAWRGVRNWFIPAAGQAPPFALLDAKLLDAIGWILRAVQRLKERRSQRVDRSVEYRHLARLFESAGEDECHALYAAAFGLYAPRHFGAPEEDPELTPSGRSFWDAEAPPIEAHLRNPDRRAPGSGRGAAITDNSMARELLRGRRERERRELDDALRRFAGRGVLRLSQLGALDETEFSHLLSWIGRALESSRDPDGRLRAESSDGLASIVLTPPPDPAPVVALQTPRGRFHTPDYGLEVSPL